MTARIDAPRSRLGGVGSRIERWIETAFGGATSDRQPLTGRSPVVRIRMGIILVVAVIASTLPIPNPMLVLGLLGVELAAQPFIATRAPDSGTAWRRFIVIDLAIATVVALVAPVLAAGHVLLAVGLMGAAATCHRAPGFLAFCSAAVVTVFLVALGSDVIRVANATVSAAVIGVGLGGLLLRTRVAADRSVEDLDQAVRAAGGVFFTGEIGNPVLHVIGGAGGAGDIESLLGWTADDDGRLGLPNLIHPDDIDDYWLPDDALYEGAEVTRTARFRTKAGGWKWIHEVTRVVERNGELQLRGLMLDHTDHQDGLMRATSEASTDALTGLSNRRVLVKLLDRETVPGRHLVLLDLNGFKRVNDTLGHEAGDELLRVVAERITHRIRDRDLLVRLGGDEFALVIDPFEGEATAPAVRLVARVLDAVAEPISLNGVVVHSSASAGVVRESEEDRGSTSMLRRADLAMYEAKRTQSGWELFSADMEQDHGRKGLLARDLAGALSSGDLRLFFQPVHDVTGRRVVAAEGLARWDHPTLGLLNPGEFLDVVLVSAQSGMFNRAMVQHAIDMVSRFESDPPCIAVNLPVSTLEDGAFARWFFERCDAAGVDPRHVTLEISETELHGDATTEMAITRLASQGVNVSIDDFGTGHATFDRLRWRDVGQLKLERFLVQGATRDDRDAAILRNVVALAKELGYEVVGEGVETEAQRRMLEEAGVDLVQGFMFSRAVDVPEFLEYVASHRREHVTIAS